MNEAPNHGWLSKYLTSGMPEISDRIAAATVLPDLDFDAQLDAINNLLRRNRNVDTVLSDKIEEVKQFAEQTSGFWNARAVEELVGHYQNSVYQDAAHSMAAVGMLAPFIESFFFQAFEGIGKEYFTETKTPARHVRFEPAAYQWDCHWVRADKGDRKWSKDLVRGIKQLSEATGLMKHLPSDYVSVLSALFAYRNKMFHCGFEWPKEERARFTSRIENGEWPEAWFTDAKSGGEIWIYYVTDAFVDHCMKTIDACLDGVGAYCKSKNNTLG